MPFHIRRRWLPGLALLATASLAQAQGAPARAERPDPLDAKANVPALTYSSSLARFRAFSDDKPLSWREANDAVARIGGWRVYAREAQQPEATPSGPGAPAAAGSAGKDASMPAQPGHHHRHQSPKGSQ